MNAKELAPLIAKLGLFGLAVWAVGSLFSDDDAEKKPETAPAGGIPRNSTEIPVNPQVSAPAMPKIPVPVPAVVPRTPVEPQTPPPPPIKRRQVTREDMATIFNCGAHALTRTAAVTALKNLGFGHTTAYQALRQGGRFSTWLQFEPDGMIIWMASRRSWRVPPRRSGSRRNGLTNVS
jgi:hypothetical protein